MTLLDRFKKIRTFVFDVDGVLTDGTLWIINEEIHMRRMHIKDGYALQLAVKMGYRVAVVSGSFSDPVANRLRNLGISDIFMKVSDKEAWLEDYLITNNLAKEEVLYMGDDVPDYPVMQKAGLSCAPADAAPDILEKAIYISPAAGGRGCVRDVIEKVLRLNGHWVLNSGIASR